VSSPTVRHESSLEKRQDLVARGNRRLTGFIDQLRGHRTVRTGHHVFEKWCESVALGCTVGQHARNEAIAERRM